MEDRLGSTVPHLPYGDERNSTAQDRMKFATYYREPSGVLDYAMNRYYSPIYGRFTSPDPYRASGGPADPGSWNRYAYVSNDPVNHSDPAGLQQCSVDFCTTTTLYTDPFADAFFYYAWFGFPTSPAIGSGV